jgi:hypothetical protein
MRRIRADSPEALQADVAVTVSIRAGGLGSVHVPNFSRGDRFAGIRPSSPDIKLGETGVSWGFDA